MDRIFVTAGGWAVASDGIQWILLRRHPRKGHPDTWDGVSFVRSTRDVLARCMREKGEEPGMANLLLAGLPETFDEWERGRRRGEASVAADDPLPEPA